MFSNTHNYTSDEAFSLEDMNAIVFLFNVHVECKYRTFKLRAILQNCPIRMLTFCLASISILV